MSKERGMTRLGDHAPAGLSAAADVDMACANCGGAFVWSRGEQRFYAERGFTPPKLCPRCRHERRERREREQSAPRDPGGRLAVEVKCAECGVETTVPFVPSHGRPVYCRDCFKRRG